MDTRRLSVRALARRMDPANIDRARRNLHRWLDEGITPNRTSRMDVARALGLDVSELEESEDEEADPVSALMHALERYVDARMTAVRKLAAANGNA
jgi:hypothetical protein